MSNEQLMGIINRSRRGKMKLLINYNIRTQPSRYKNTYCCHIIERIGRFNLPVVMTSSSSSSVGVVISCQ